MVPLVGCGLDGGLGGESVGGSAGNCSSWLCVRAFVC
jgi:hypothetical protein